MKHIFLRRLLLAICFFGLLASAPGVRAQNVKITEFAYNGLPGEFVEITNLGTAPVDLTRWSYSDDSRAAGVFSLSAIGTLNPQESAIITETTAAAFRTAWSLPGTVKVAGGSTPGLGRADEINIYDAAGALADRLTYGDQTFPGTIRTDTRSGWTTPDNLGANRIDAWRLSTAGDAQNSYANASNPSVTGNPGRYIFVAALTASPRSLTLATTATGTPSVAQSYSLTSFSLTTGINVTAPAGVEISTATGGPYSPSLSLPASTTATLIYARLTGATAGPVSGTITQVSGALSATVAVTGTVSAGTPPTIRMAATTTPFLSFSASGPAFISGVVGNPTDPATTLGVDFTLTTANSVGSLTVTARSSNVGVVPTANLVLTGTGTSRNLKITPAGVGYTTITVSATDASGLATYVINYAASAASTSTSRFHTGTSDASTAQAVGAGYMLVADDENQVLRLYDRNNSGLPVNGFNYSSSLGLSGSSEVDIEGSVQLGNRIYWIGSHGNNKDGEARPNRNRLFATDVTGSGAGTTLSYVGRYDNLKTDLIAWDNANGKPLSLEASAAPGVAPEADGGTGFNIEGLTIAPDGTTGYVAFRAPIVPATSRTRALIVPVTNFTSLVAGNPATGPATFGPAILLDLGGRGIREIKRSSGGDYLIVAGPSGGFGPAPNDFRLYTWTGVATDAPVLRTADLSGLGGPASSIESIVDLPATLTNASSIQLLTDNGDAVYYTDGTIAKDLAQPAFRKFRSDIVTLGAPVVAPTSLRVLHRDASNGQFNTNAIYPYFILENTGSTAIPYSELTVRYYLTVENPAPVTNLPVYSADFGAANVQPVFVALSPARTGATGYVEYSFRPAAGSLGAMSNSGAVATAISKQDYSAFNQADDYSYVRTGDFTPNPKFTAYRNGVLIWGTEPTLPGSDTAPLTVSATATSPVFPTTDNSTLVANANGGSGVYSYSFTGPGTITRTGNTAVVSNQSAGVQTFTVVVTDTSTPTAQTATATVSVTVTGTANPTPVATGLRVLHRDASNGQFNTNAIYPYFILDNTGSSPIPYSELTIRYYLTVENPAPVTNLPIYSADFGAANVQPVFVTLNPARTGATGYVEYSFRPTAGSLGAMSNSGVVSTAISKQDYSAFNQADDYSYALNRDFTPNPKFTAYRNGVLIWGTEPVSGARQSAETGAGLQLQVLGNPVSDRVSVSITGAAGEPLTVTLSDAQGRVIGQRSLGADAGTQVVEFGVSQQAAGMLLLRASTPTRQQTSRIFKAM